MMQCLATLQGSESPNIQLMCEQMQQASRNDPQWLVLSTRSINDALVNHEHSNLRGYLGQLAHGRSLSWVNVNDPSVNSIVTAPDWFAGARDRTGLEHKEVVS